MFTCLKSISAYTRRNRILNLSERIVVYSASLMMETCIENHIICLFFIKSCTLLMLLLNSTRLITVFHSAWWYWSFSSYCYCQLCLLCLKSPFLLLLSHLRVKSRYDLAWLLLHWFSKNINSSFLNLNLHPSQLCQNSNSLNHHLHQYWNNYRLLQKRTWARVTWSNSSVTVAENQLRFFFHFCLILYQCSNLIKTYQYILYWEKYSLIISHSTI